MVRYQNHRVLTVNKAPRFSDKQQTTEGTHPHSLKKKTKKKHENLMLTGSAQERKPVVTNRRARAG